MKKLIKDFTPPVVLRLAQKISIKKSVQPALSWHAIQGGYLKGINIYVDNKVPLFSEMTSGVFDDFLWDYLKNKSFHGSTILDIGAHIGYHSLAFARMTGSNGRVIAFEPNPGNLERMNKNISGNKDLSATISVEPVALSDEDREVVFNFSTNVDDETSSGGYIENSYKPLADSVYKKAGFTTQKIRTNRLDTIAGQNNYQNIKLIKLDVEGAEHLVLSGAIETIKKNLPLLFIEVHSVTAMFHVCEILFNLNYDAQIIKEDGVSRCFIISSPKN